jgi:hypothetical protein
MLNEFFPSQIVTQLEQKQPFSEPFHFLFCSDLDLLQVHNRFGMQQIFLQSYQSIFTAAQNKDQ